MLAERFAFCQTMGMEQFLSVAQALRPAGYRPVCFRPYSVGKTIQVAAAWTRDGRDWQIAHGATADAIQQQNADWRAKGYRPRDVAAYFSGDRADQPRYAVLWVKTEEQTVDAILYVGLV